MSKRNEQLWDELAKNNVLCSQPRFRLTPESARAYINRHGFYGDDLASQKVLCLASGGGQQSIAFALLGAEVTVVDFSEEQLQKEHLAAQHYHMPLTIVKSDMRDLSVFADAAFDIVYQPYSINYIPNATAVFDEVCRVLRPNGLYDLMLHNPFVHGSWRNGCWEGEWQTTELWKGKGYPIWQPYQDGQAVEVFHPYWNFENSKGEAVEIPSPQEYRHTLSTVLNGLLERGFNLLRFEEEVGTDSETPLGSWDHYISCAPPWFYIVCRKER
jgi:ubiquinone/menaquinone biosynthesis C-methylase UbiE